ncbi:hypothetical protein CPC08DRAFT_707701 [Agrocybe pediades]|nr:hypothetical protein CPC08DRAFT_707701 [Agrocybe pediades]
MSSFKRLIASAIFSVCVLPSVFSSPITALDGDHLSEARAESTLHRFVVYEHVANDPDVGHSLYPVPTQVASTTTSTSGASRTQIANPLPWSFLIAAGVVCSLI